MIFSSSGTSDICVSLPSAGVAEPEGDWEDVEGVGAMPRISEIWTDDFEEMLLAAMARARCLPKERNQTEGVELRNE